MSIENLLNAVRAKRETENLNVHFLGEDGTPDVFSFANADSRDAFRASLKRRNLIIIDRELLAAEYVDQIGYDPFNDDPNITELEVAMTLRDYRAEVAAKREAE